MAYGYPKKGRKAAKSPRRSTGGRTGRASGGGKRGGSSTRGRSAPAVIRIELVQAQPTGLAGNPALPIPPSVRTPKSQKAKL